MVIKRIIIGSFVAFSGISIWWGVRKYGNSKADSREKRNSHTNEKSEVKQCYEDKTLCSEILVMPGNPVADSTVPVIKNSIPLPVEENEEKEGTMNVAKESSSQVLSSDILVMPANPVADLTVPVTKDSTVTEKKVMEEQDMKMDLEEPKKFKLKSIRLPYKDSMYKIRRERPSWFL
jgi:hypothetical protein